MAPLRVAQTICECWRSRPCPCLAKDAACERRVPPRTVRQPRGYPRLERWVSRTFLLCRHWRHIENYLYRNVYRTKNMTLTNKTTPAQRRALRSRPSRESCWRCISATRPRTFERASSSASRRGSSLATVARRESFAILVFASPSGRDHGLSAASAGIAVGAAPTLFWRGLASSPEADGALEDEGRCQGE